MINNVEIFSCLFINEGDVWFGSLKDVVGLDVEITQDLDFVVLDLACSSLVYRRLKLAHTSYIGTNSGAH